MKKTSSLLSAFLMGIFLVSCTSEQWQPIYPITSVPIYPSSNNKANTVKNLGKELPIRTIVSQLQPQNTSHCIIERMQSFLGIPSSFIEKINMADQSQLILLKNPYSNSQGVYFIVKLKDHYRSEVSLFKNKLPFLSHRWHQLMDQCL
jgi:lipoprotein